MEPEEAASDDEESRIPPEVVEALGASVEKVQQQAAGFSKAVADAVRPTALGAAAAMPRLDFSRFFPKIPFIPPETFRTLTAPPPISFPKTDIESLAVTIPNHAAKTAANTAELVEQQVVQGALFEGLREDMRASDRRNRRMALIAIGIASATLLVAVATLVVTIVFHVL